MFVAATLFQHQLLTTISRSVYNTLCLTNMLHNSEYPTDSRNVLFDKTYGKGLWHLCLQLTRLAKKSFAMPPPRRPRRVNTNQTQPAKAQTIIKVHIQTLYIYKPVPYSIRRAGSFVASSNLNGKHQRKTPSQSNRNRMHRTNTNHQTVRAHSHLFSKRGFNRSTSVISPIWKTGGKNLSQVRANSLAA